MLLLHNLNLVQRLGEWGRIGTLIPVSYTHLTLPTNREV